MRTQHSPFDPFTDLLAPRSLLVLVLRVPSLLLEGGRYKLLHVALKQVHVESVGLAREVHRNTGSRCIRTDLGRVGVGADVEGWRGDTTRIGERTLEVMRLVAFVAR